MAADAGESEEYRGNEVPEELTWRCPMSEKRWLKSSRPQRMLDLLTDANDRKFRLYGVACCRAALHRFPAAITVAERSDDGLASAEELAAVHERACRTVHTNISWDWEAIEDMAVMVATGPSAKVAATAHAMTAFARGSRTQPWWMSGEPDCIFTQRALKRWSCVKNIFTVIPAILLRRWYSVKAEPEAEILRDVFGNPYRPVAMEAGWSTEVVRTLARVIYHERRYEDMPVLADAVEDAGCAQTELLRHLREKAHHVRGCWALDVLLGLK